MDSEPTHSPPAVLSGRRGAGYLITAGIIGIAALMSVAGFDWRYLLPMALLIMLLLYLLAKTLRPESPVNETVESRSISEVISDSMESSGPARATVPGREQLTDIELLLISSAGNKTSPLQQQLSGWGIHVTHVTSSVRAFSILYTAAQSDAPYHTVLVDASHLDMDDCQFATALRAEPTLQSLYLIHYGGNVMPARTEQLYTAGWSKILKSPVDKTLLFNALHSAQATAGGEDNIIQLLDHYQSNGKQPPLDILIGCPNNSECQRIRKMLSTAGHQVFVINDSSQILDALENHHFDLAILEAEMSGISGIESIKLYRFAHLDEHWIPFILLLDNPTSTTIQICESGGIDHLLPKPVNAKRLFSTITRALEDKTHNQELYHSPASRDLKRYHDDELILDTHQLEQLMRLGKEPLFLRDLVKQFIEETEQLVKRLQGAIDQNDQKRLHILGHQLKDTAGNLGALNLYRLAVRITRVSDNRDQLQAEQLVQAIQTCRTATIEALHDYLSESNNPAYRKD